MRYRPFGPSGGAISNITLSLGVDALHGGADRARDLVFAALEAGINSYRFESADPVLAEVIGDALQHVARDLIVVGLTLGQAEGRRAERDFTAEGLTGAIDRCLNRSGLGWIDVALLDEPGEDELSRSSLAALKALRATERVRLLGIAGDGDVMDAYVTSNAFDVLMTPYHVDASWKVRSRLRAARERDMIVMACDHASDTLARERRESARRPSRGLFDLGRLMRRPKSSSAAPDGFAFLHRIPNWSAEDLCLGYLMTEPSIATVVVKPRDVDHLNAMAAVPDRDLPAGLSAQIEMARVGQAAA